MEKIWRNMKDCYSKMFITYFMTCYLLLNTSLSVASAEVVLDGIIRGDITVSPLGAGTTQNMTASDGAIAYFSDFDIAAGHMVNCVQPSADSSALFIVSSGDGTQINGQFDATGHIYLVDTAGMLFGAGSQINVTRLVASGLEITTSSFDAILGGGQMEFSGGDGTITNRGVINADGVYLIGEKVLNLGPIIANEGGLIVLAAGDQVILAQDGSDVSVVVSGLGDDSPDIRNAGNVIVSDGKIVFAAGDTFSRAVRNVGILAVSNGEVLIQAAKVENNGWITANNSSGDGGSVNLTGTESVSIGVGGLGVSSIIDAEAGTNSDGGSVTIQTDGLLQMGEDATITASGGSVSGNGGTVSITCDDFEIAGEITASPGNKIYEPGKLEITTPSVTIADGANAGATDTLYVEDIEALSQDGTSLIINSDDSITVQDIMDNEIAGRFGNIELHATGASSLVSFSDISDIISTTLGDIIIEAGSGGIDVGNLITGKDLLDEKPSAGQIRLTTENEGDIETGYILIESGWRHAEINVNASGNLTVEGDVKVGSESAIRNVPPYTSAEAMIYLSAADNVALHGDVYANAHGIEEAEDTTKAYIGIFAGTNQNSTGDATINGELVAKAKASSNGISEATIEIDSWGKIIWGSEVDAPFADADTVSVTSYTSAVDISPEGDIAQIIINKHIPDIDEILDFIYDSVEDGTLTGNGPGNSGENRLNALINMLEETQRLIDAEMFEEAYEQLNSAYLRTDGESPPPDFVTGEAASELANLIMELMESL